MKRLVIGAFSVLLIFAGILLTVRHLDALVEDVAGQIDTALLLAQNGDFENAEAALRSAMEIWEKDAAYTNTCIRHSELSSVSDAFFDMIDAIRIGDEDAALVSGEKLKYKLFEIQRLEHFSLSSVF